MVYAQDAKVPVLKDNVARVILQTQRDVALAQTQQLQILQAYNENQLTQQKLNAELSAKLATALKDSNIDPLAFSLNPQTLEVTPHPKQLLPAKPTDSETK